MATLEGITLTRSARAAISAAAVSGALLAGGFATAPVVSADPVPVPSAPCYNGVFPLNPYVDNCALPGRPRRTLGSAPDQTALLNCNIGSDALRAQCLSLYVNGGYGWYPGAVLVPGYHP
ncbi:hypothetical protein [Mycolicibacterium sp.]|uniref:hypothetical protein n=1 Tax=Mycolicibacterium sp. TaxID=2320850 RepID=UPI001D6CD950|nr:hypothetical protein [Mycolicibacterium sp.]MCB1290410.1 hypothetical protein [Mycobacterium sp.]MCB9407987.1 hypothetical protein [Mycolicibacterium sp.]